MADVSHSDSPHEPAAPAARRTRRIALAALAVFVFASALYLPSLRNGFVWDDVQLVENPGVRTLDWPTVKRVFSTNYWQATEVTSGLYRPLTALSLHADYQLHGSKPAGFHLTNVLINAAASALVFLVVLEMFAALDMALIAALFFAAFPMHTENGAWVSGRTDLIATLFMLASLWCYAHWRSRGRPAALAGMLVFFGVALMGKEIAVVLPAVIAVAEILPLQHERTRSGRMTGAVATGAMFVVAALYFVLRHHVLGSAVSHFHRFTTGAVQAAALSFSIVAHYAYKLVFPFRLNAESDFPPPATLWNVHTLVGIAIVAAACFALYRWRRHSAFVFGMAVIGFGLAPVLNVLPVNQVLAERFLYFPSVGYSLLVALAVLALRRRWRLPATIAFALLLAACSARTVTRVFDWKDELTLFQKTVAVSGNNARARTGLGNSLFDLERYDEALNEFRIAVRLNPAYAPGWSGLARTEAKLGRVEQAHDDMLNATDLDPTNAGDLNSLGILEFQVKQYRDAAESFRRALALQPRHMHARFNLGLALYQQRDFEGAVREFTALEGKDTDFVNAYFFIAESQAQLGHNEEAAHAASQFLALHTSDDAMTSRAREIAGTK